jgi:hypothetical protein
VAGEVVDSLPRVQPARPFTAAERRATALYRSVRPTFPALARRALVAFAALFGVFAAAAVWNARRLPAPDVRRPGRWRPLRYPATWTSRAIAPTPLQQAGFWLALQTIVRRPHARAALTTAFAGGLAVVVVAVRDRALTVQADPASIPLPLLAAQMLLLGSVLIGFRRAAHVPADLRASVAFRVAWDGRLQPFVGGIKRAAMISLATPLLAVLFAWHAAVFGPRVAGQHLAAGAAFCGLLLNVLFARYRRVPFVSPAASGDEPASRYAAYAVAIPLASFIVAWLERVTLESPPAFAALLAVLVGFAQAVAIADRLTAASGPLFEFDDTPVLPTQRLDLAG